MQTKKKAYGLMLSLTIMVTLAGIWTLIPDSSASEACVLGYKAHCTFTPISTLICVILAAVFCKIRKKKFTA